jgi:hypothetical protein
MVNFLLFWKKFGENVDFQQKKIVSFVGLKTDPKINKINKIK